MCSTCRGFQHLECKQSVCVCERERERERERESNVICSIHERWSASRVKSCVREIQNEKGLCRARLMCSTLKWLSTSTVIVVFGTVKK